MIQHQVFVFNQTSDTTREIVTYDGDGNILKRNVNTIDPQTKKSTWATYNADGSFADKAVYDVDYSDRRWEQSSHNADGTLANKRVSVGEPAGRTFSSTDYAQDGTVRAKQSQEREIDAHGNIVKEVSSRLNIKTGEMEPYSVVYKTITYRNN